MGEPRQGDPAVLFWPKEMVSSSDINGLGDSSGGKEGRGGWALTGEERHSQSKPNLGAEARREQGPTQQSAESLTIKAEQ